MKQDRSRSAGIKQIAEALKISIGTVDRALHRREGVSAETRSRVLAMAETLKYRPNVAARSLKLNQSLRIGVHLPQHIASFFDPMREGVRAAAGAPVGAQVEVDFRTYPTLGEGDIDLLEKDLEKGYDGIILIPGIPQRIDPVLRQFAIRKTPVVCVSSDAPLSPRLASVSVDAYVSGCIAAQLLAMSIPQKGSVVALTGHLSMQSHAEKLRGFAATLAVMAPRLQLLAAVESHDKAKEAYRETVSLIKSNPDLNGIYINTANSLPVMRAIEEHGLLGRIQVVTTDLFPELIPLIESGSIVATLHQRPFTLGKLAFEKLISYLIDHAEPETITRLAPHIVLRSNLSRFSETM